MAKLSPVSCVLDWDWSGRFGNSPGSLGSFQGICMVFVCWGVEVHFLSKFVTSNAILNYAFFIGKIEETFCRTLLQHVYALTLARLIREHQIYVIFSHRFCTMNRTRHQYLQSLHAQYIQQTFQKESSSIWEYEKGTGSTSVAIPNAKLETSFH